MPPSTRIIWPDIHQVLSVSRNSAIAAISSGVPIHFKGCHSALTCNNLVDELDGTGQFTFLAPTNSVFTALGVDLATISDEAGRVK